MKEGKKAVRRMMDLMIDVTCKLVRSLARSFALSRAKGDFFEGQEGPGQAGLSV